MRWFIDILEAAVSSINFDVSCFFYVCIWRWISGGTCVSIIVGGSIGLSLFPPREMSCRLVDLLIL